MAARLYWVVDGMQRLAIVGKTETQKCRERKYV